MTKTPGAVRSTFGAALDSRAVDSGLFIRTLTAEASTMANLKDAARTLLGACLVYGLVSACAGSGVDGTAKAGSGAGGATSTGATGSGGGAPAPQVFTEACSKTWTVNGEMFAYAEHFFPGATAEDLIGSVTEAGHFKAGQTGAFQPQGYAYAPISQGAPYVFFGDELVGVGCGPSAGPNFDTVTFIRR